MKKTISELKDELTKANSSSNNFLSFSKRSKYDSHDNGNGNSKHNSNTSKHNTVIKSLLCIIIEMCELYFEDNNYNNKTNRSLNGNAQIDATLNNDCNYNDNYFQDTFNIKEDTKMQLIDHILVLLIGKMEYINSALGISLNKEIEKLNSLRKTSLTKSRLSLSLSLSSSVNNNANYNLFNSPSINKKVHLRSASTLTDYSSNLYSILLPQSPKFCGGDDGLNPTLNKSKTNNEVTQKDNEIMKKLLFKEYKSDSIDDFYLKKVNDVNCNYENTKKNEGNDNNNQINILECSIGDLVSASSEQFVHFNGNIDYFTLDGKSDD